MAVPVVSPVRGCGPNADARGPSACKLMSLSHSLAAGRLIPTGGCHRARSERPKNTAPSYHPCFVKCTIHERFLATSVTRAGDPRAALADDLLVQQHFAF